MALATAAQSALQGFTDFMVGPRGYGAFFFLLGDLAVDATQQDAAPEAAGRAQALTPIALRGQPGPPRPDGVPIDMPTHSQACTKPWPT